MRVLVTGGRDYQDMDRVYEVLGLFKELAYHRSENLTIVTGACPTGADKLASVYVHSYCDCHIEEHPAANFGSWPSCGPRRNAYMVGLGADFVVAFPGGRGTSDCVAKAKRAGILTFLVG